MDDLLRKFLRDKAYVFWVIALLVFCCASIYSAIFPFQIPNVSLVCYGIALVCLWYAKYEIIWNFRHITQSHGKSPAVMCLLCSLIFLYTGILSLFSTHCLFPHPLLHQILTTYVYAAGIYLGFHLLHISFWLLYGKIYEGEKKIASATFLISDLVFFVRSIIIAVVIWGFLFLSGVVEVEFLFFCDVTLKVVIGVLAWRMIAGNDGISRQTLFYNEIKQQEDEVLQKRFQKVSELTEEDVEKKFDSEKSDLYKTNFISFLKSRFFTLGALLGIGLPLWVFIVIPMQAKELTMIWQINMGIASMCLACWFAYTFSQSTKEYQINKKGIRWKTPLFSKTRTLLWLQVEEIFFHENILKIKTPNLSESIFLQEIESCDKLLKNLLNIKEIPIEIFHISENMWLQLKKQKDSHIENFVKKYEKERPLPKNFI